MSDAIDDATKKIKNTEQDTKAKAETTEDHAEGRACHATAAQLPPGRQLFYNSPHSDFFTTYLNSLLCFCATPKTEQNLQNT